MSGNGVPITGMLTMKERQRMDVLGLIKNLKRMIIK
jgi:hypothetical protein